MNQLFLALALFAAEPPSVEPPIADPITFPVAFGTNKIESRNAALSVSKGVYYIIESKVDCLALCSPKDSLTITNLRVKYPTGPIILGGRFARPDQRNRKRVFRAVHLQG